MSAEDVAKGRQIGKILVPVDFSEGSRAAVEEARALARVFGASIEILHAWPIPALIPPDMKLVRADETVTTFESEARREAEEDLEIFLRSINSGASVPTTSKFMHGDPVRAICEEATNFDLVVMGTHGRTGLSRLLLGSVTEAVIRKSRTPVLTVHPPAIPAAKEARDGAL